MSDRSGWKCERCKHAGEIEHGENTDVYSMLDLLDVAHRAASQSTCTDIANVRAWPIPNQPSGDASR